MSSELLICQLLDFSDFEVCTTTHFGVDAVDSINLQEHDIVETSGYVMLVSVELSNNVMCNICHVHDQ